MNYLHSGEEYYIFLSNTGELCLQPTGNELCIIGNVESEYIDLIQDLLKDFDNQQFKIKTIRNLVR